MTLIHFAKSSEAIYFALFGYVLYARGDLDKLSLADDSRWFMLSTKTINIRTRKRTIYHNFKELACGKPLVKDIATGPKEEIRTSEGWFVVQPAQRRTTYPRFAKPSIDPRSFYLIHEHPFDTDASVILTRNVEGVVGDSPLDAIDTFRDLIKITEDMASEFKATFNQPE